MNITREVDNLYREYAGVLISSLVVYFKLNQLQAAEDIVQETFISAIKNWEVNGLPDNPKAWLFKVCKNKCINELNKKLLSLDGLSDQPQAFPEIWLPDELRDNQLRLLFATCHPDFSTKAQIILTLKTVASFKEHEIALGLGMTREAVKKVLSRTRSEIRTKNLLLKVPFRLQSKARLNIVHQVLYLIFNEGYKASAGNQLIRKDLCLQAMRLTRLLLDSPQLNTPDTHALFSLMIFNVARFSSRISPDGELMELKDQDRSLWDYELIMKGISHLNQANQLTEVRSRYHLEAGIASIHCLAKNFENTNWTAILRLYEQLKALSPSPFVRLNYCIALHYQGDSEKALQQIDTIKGLESNLAYLCTKAMLYRHFQQTQKVVDYYLEALSVAQIPAEKLSIQKKLDELKLIN
ncbi:sigma-70 family RNA polymerase sigma factor [Fulvivirga maritima]|uniref:RNA polymerase sigma factor n=1 Tax=Fulvivirga maritima TaxID=2904247 RepID=UPI001F19067B|nr:sigma-70 family RNA polymerase sigma factor [Fulvivirga maritima]UII25010.1 sigma-70 family RNA polymerase sigma factor [Fulvivirga maritima]